MREVLLVVSMSVVLLRSLLMLLEVDEMVCAIVTNDSFLLQL